jgi:hypothetical protein
MNKADTINKLLANIEKLYGTINENNVLRNLEINKKTVATENETMIYNRIVECEKELTDNKNRLFALLGEKV